MAGIARKPVLVLLFCSAALLASSCGVGNPTTGITSREGQARNAQAVTSLQQALITASTVATDGSGGQGAQLASELQARDPNNVYSAALPTQPGNIQVIGGGGGPLLLVGYSQGDGGRPGYVGAWQSGGTTRWYSGSQPPAYVAAVPSSAGWSASAPTAASPSSAVPVSTAAP